MKHCEMEIFWIGPYLFRNGPLFQVQQHLLLGRLRNCGLLMMLCQNKPGHLVLYTLVIHIIFMVYNAFYREGANIQLHLVPCPFAAVKERLADELGWKPHLGLAPPVQRLSDITQRLRSILSPHIVRSDEVCLRWVLHNWGQIKTVQILDGN